MTRTQRGRRGAVGLFVALSVIAAACGDDEEAAETAATLSSVADTAAASDGTGAAGTTAAVEQDNEELDLTMGGSASSSSVFSLITAQARIAGDADGSMSINIRETGASSENIQLLQDGAVDFGLSGLSTVIQAQRGLDAFEGKAYPDICGLMVYLKNAEFITVREDAGINTVADLEGKSFAPSFQGSALYDNILAYFEVLGISVNVFDGSLEDIVNAVKDGRIVGFGKSGNGLGADASMLDVSSAVPVKAIGFSQEQVDQILGASADNALLYQFTEIEPGSIYDNEEAFLSPVVIASYFTDSTKMNEDAQYRLSKSMFEALQQAATETNYAGAKGITVEDTLSTADKLPLCPGSEKYFNEVG